MKQLAIGGLFLLLVAGCAHDTRKPLERTQFVISRECRTGMHATDKTECVELNDHQAKCNEVIVDFSCITVNKQFKKRKGGK